MMQNTGQRKLVNLHELIWRTEVIRFQPLYPQSRHYLASQALHLHNHLVRRSHEKLRDDGRLLQGHTVNPRQTLASFHTTPPPPANQSRLLEFLELSRKITQLELKSGGPCHKERSPWSLSFFLWHSFWSSLMLFQKWNRIISL